MAPDTISAHDVSVKILRRFRAEHTPQDFQKNCAVCRLAFGFSCPPCFLVHITLLLGRHLDPRFSSSHHLSMTFPASLQSLTFSDDFNEPLRHLDLPNLETLSLGAAFNQSLEDVSRRVFYRFFLFVLSFLFTAHQELKVDHQ